MYLIKTSERFLQFDRIFFPDNYGMQMKSKKREESEKKPWITPACKEMFPSDEDEDQKGDLEMKTMIQTMMLGQVTKMVIWEMRGKLRYFIGKWKP